MNTTGSIADELDPEYRMDGSCWKFEPVYSDGIWYQMLQNKENILKHSSVRLNIQISIIFFLTSFIHFFLRRIHLPRIVAEILAGMILGPSLIGKYFPGLSTIFFPPDSMKILSTLMRFGYLFFMFLIGVKMDAGLLRKSGSKSWVIGTINTLVPMLTMVTIAKDISRTSDKYPEPAVEWVSVFSGTLMITSFPAVALLLTHLKIINSELGHLALSSALVSDTTSVVLINLESYLKLIFGVSPRVGFKSIFLSMLLIIVIVTFLRSTMYWIIRRTPEGKPVRSNYVFLVVILVMLVGIIGDNVGLQFLYGPFIFGLIVPTGPPLASVLVERLDTIVTGLLLPLISTLCGFRSNLWELQHSPPMFLTFMLSCGFTVKLLSTFIPASCCRVPRRDAALLSLICSAQSIVQLGVFITNFNKQPLASGQFTIAVLTVFVLATAIPVIISSVYDPSEKYLGYQKRTIVHSTEAEGLRILVSAHRQDDALAAAKLLDITAPTKESPLFVIGLYLESLVGGSTPLILDHQLGQKLSTFGGSRWQPVIDVFTLFKSKHDKSAQVKVFTAISPSKLMHEHISWVAFDHSVSLIILPFHKKWNAKGNVVMENNAARLLNSNVRMI
ncbi:cation/H(+) antiporter 15-like isoform X2 [Carica papaya]|uniref:cation/H(+) antiporter 15-like isoform X2 n=1 Tax=Carica papaya TaxID=3649 RepID=UPI000B8CC31C|nr:cation/H(+) antiporter 15-like isoform X2 [Carica papaya]